MFTITKDQLATLSKMMEQAYEERLRQHVAEHFPDLAKSLGEPALRVRLRGLIAEARVYGITSQRGIAYYVDSCLALGVDPRQYPWAVPLLRDRTLEGDVKAQRFCDRTILHLEEVMAKS